MKTKAHIIVLLAFLVLAGMIVSPVSADDFATDFPVCTAFSPVNDVQCKYMGSVGWNQTVNYMGWTSQDFIDECSPGTTAEGYNGEWGANCHQGIWRWKMGNSEGDMAFNTSLDFPQNTYLVINSSLMNGKKYLAVQVHKTDNDDRLALIWNITGLEYNPPIPTPTPTPEPTPIPGYVRTTYKTVDFATGYTILGTNINLYDTYAGTWKNSSSDADGTLWIDTLPYTTINAYASGTGYESALLTAVAQNTARTLYISMMKTGSAPAGNTSFVFQAKNAVSLFPISSATIIAQWSGVQHPCTTNSAGSCTIIIPNNTVIYASASKPGYDGQTTTFNTGPTSTGSYIFYLSQAYVTPTITATAGPGGTVPTTYAPGTGPGGYDPGYANTQGQYYMNWLAQNGFSLVVLCFLFTIIGLVKMASK